MHTVKNLQFVLFYPVSICIDRDKRFRYDEKFDTFYPCLLGYRTEDNKCVEVISGREFDIIPREDYILLCNREYLPNYWIEITNDSNPLRNPVYIFQEINKSVENFRFIEKYIDDNGKLSQKEISKYGAFRDRLNHLFIKKSNDFTNKPEKFIPLIGYGFAKYYLRKIDIDNGEAIERIKYVSSGQKSSDDSIKKNDIILRLTKKITPPKK